MKHFRYMLLCLSLLSAVGLMAGCSCGNPQDETTASSPAETSSTGMNETGTQESGMQESSSSQGDIYETGNGYQDSTGGIEDGAGSMGTDEGMLPEDGTYDSAYDSTHDRTENGSTNGTDNDGGLMGDVTDGLEQMGDDISDAVDDVADGARTRSR